MKKINLSVILLLVTIISFGQTNETSSGRQFIDRTNGSILYSFQYQDIKGFPFLNDDWSDAKVIVGNTTFTNVKLKFDIVNNEFIFVRNDSNFTLSSTASEIRMFSGNGDSTVFKKGFNLPGSGNQSKYVQILAEGKIIFVKFWQKNIEEYMEYGDATKYKRFVELNPYYVGKDGAFQSAKLGKKELQSLLADKWDKVNDYMSRNNLSGKDEKSYAAAIKYYNSL